MFHDCVVHLSFIASKTYPSFSFDGDTLDSDHPLLRGGNSFGLREYSTTVSVLECLLSGVGRNHDSEFSANVILPTHVVAEHICKIMKTDSDMECNVNTLGLRKQCLALFSSYIKFAKSSLLMHHAALMQAFQAAYAWSMNHQKASLSALLDCFCVYMQHVPVGHLESAIYSSFIEALLTDTALLTKYLRSFVSCRSSLWCLLPFNKRSEVESRLCKEMTEGNLSLDNVSFVITTNNATHLPCLPLLFASSGLSSDLAQLAMQFRPLPPIWPTSSLPNDGSPVVVSSNVFSDFESFDRMKRNAEEDILEVNEQPKKQKNQEVAKSPNVQPIVEVFDLVEKEKKHSPPQKLSSPQKHSSLQKLPSSPIDSSDSDLDDLPMIVEGDPSSMSEGE